MILDDLRTGDIVEFRNGQHFIVMPTENAEDTAGYEFFPYGGDFKNYNVNMCRGCGSNVCTEFDVMKVCKSSEAWSGYRKAILDICLNGGLETEEVEWAWEREKEDELRNAKRELETELDAFDLQMQRINEKLMKLEKRVKCAKDTIEIKVYVNGEERW